MAISQPSSMLHLVQQLIGLLILPTFLAHTHQNFEIKDRIQNFDFIFLRLEKGWILNSLKGRYGFLLPEDQIKPVEEEMYAAFTVMGDQVLAGRCDSK